MGRLTEEFFERISLSFSTLCPSGHTILASVSSGFRIVSLSTVKSCDDWVVITVVPVTLHDLLLILKFLPWNSTSIVQKLGKMLCSPVLALVNWPFVFLK